MASLIAQVTSGGPMFFVLILLALLALILYMALRQSREPEEDHVPAPQLRHARPEPLPRRVPPVRPEPDAAYMGRHGRDPVGPPVTIDRLQVPGSPPWQPALKPPEVSLSQGTAAAPGRPRSLHPGLT
jgi:hypothetical protein